MDPNSTTSRVVLVGLVFSGIVAIIALILGATAMANTGSSQRSGSGGATQGASGGAAGGTVNIQIGGPAQKPRVYTIAHGHDYHSNEFVDPQGKVRGFTIDMIDAVCNKAGIQCKKIWEPYANCWDSQAGRHPFLGKGLASKWYDSCAAWVMTVARNHSLGFTDSYLKTDPAWFYTSPSSTFNQNDLSGITKPIGFLDGWFSDEKCLARQTNVKNSILPVSKIKHFTDTGDMQKAILDGSLAAGFGPTENYLKAYQAGTLKRLGQTSNGKEVGYACAIRGSCMLARKDNVEFINKWNAGFRKLVASGEFKKMCEESYTKYKAYGTHVCIDV